MASPLRRRPTPALGDAPVTLDTRLAILEQQLSEMAAGVEEFVKEINTVVDNLMEQQAECNLRLMFILQHFKFAERAKDGLVGLDGKPTSPSRVLTLYDIFCEGRDAFEKKIQEQIHAELEAQRQHPSDPPSAPELAHHDKRNGDGRPTPLAPAGKLVS